MQRAGKKWQRCHAVFLLLPFVSSSSVDAHVWSHPIQLTSRKHLLSLPFYMSLSHALFLFIGAIFKGTKVSNSFQRPNCTTPALWIFSSNWQRKLFNLESSTHSREYRKLFLARNNRVSRFSPSCFPLSRDSFIIFLVVPFIPFVLDMFNRWRVTRQLFVIFVTFVSY